MMLGRIIGNVVATVKHPALEGKKLLLVQPIARDGRDRGRPLVALDAIGAGFRETVYWCRGKESALAFSGGDIPCDASVVGIVDAITPPLRPKLAGGGTPDTVPARKRTR